MKCVKCVKCVKSMRAVCVVCVVYVLCVSGLYIYVSVYIDVFCIITPLGHNLDSIFSAVTSSDHIHASAPV